MCETQSKYNVGKYFFYFKYQNFRETLGGKLLILSDPPHY